MFASEVLGDPNKTKQLHAVITGLFLAVLAHAEGWTYSRGPTLRCPAGKVVVVQPNPEVQGTGKVRGRHQVQAHKASMSFVTVCMEHP